MPRLPAEKTILIHHAANRDHGFPPNSMGAINNCLSAGARMVEIDCIPLLDEDFALLHDADLSYDTNGEGRGNELTAGQIKELVYLHRGKESSEPVATLSQVIQRLQNANGLQCLQIDLKAHTPLTENVLRNLLAIIAPLKERVLISSVADWAIRTLRGLDPEVNLGLDPLLYLDVVDESGNTEEYPPFRVGAYGFRDDHPLSAFIWGKTSDYLEARAEALLAQCPEGVMWFIKAQLLLQMQENGFDWLAFLAGKGSRVAAWTLDAVSPQDIDAAKSLIELGAAAITTNQPTRMGRILDGLVEY